MATTDDPNLNIKPVRTALNAMGRDQIRSLAKDLNIQGTGTKSDTRLINMILDLYKKMGIETRQRYAKKIMGKQPTAADPYKIIGSSREKETGFKKLEDTATERRGPARKTPARKDKATPESDRAQSLARLQRKADKVPTPRSRPSDMKSNDTKPKAKSEGKPKPTVAAEKPKRKGPRADSPAGKAQKDNSESLADRLTARMMELQSQGMSNKEATEQLIKERKAGKFAKGGTVKKKKTATKKSNKGHQDFRGDYGCTMSTVDNRKKRKK